jgi:hydroxymethylbilane synthase
VPGAQASGGSVIRLGARKSPLARAQVELVAALLARAGLASTFVGVTTVGDVDRRDLTEIGGTGVFATAVRDALYRAEIDVAVHSLKDLPTADAPDLRVIAIPEREDTRDVLVGRRLDQLEDGARVGTGAPRRAVQLQDWADRTGRPLDIVPVRGNVDTRIELARTGVVDAVLLAGAGLSRLGHLELVDSDNKDIVVKGLPSDILGHDVMLPAPGQGALALEIHSSLSPDLQFALTELDHPESRAEALVERSFLGALEAGCTAPVGARARVKSVHGKGLDLTLAAVIGRTLVSNLSEPTKTSPVLRIDAHGSFADPAQFGVAQAGVVLTRLRQQR